MASIDSIDITEPPVMRCSRVISQLDHQLPPHRLRSISIRLILLSYSLMAKKCKEVSLALSETSASIWCKLRPECILDMNVCYAILQMQLNFLEASTESNLSDLHTLDKFCPKTMLSADRELRSLNPSCYL